MGVLLIVIHALDFFAAEASHDESTRTAGRGDFPTPTTGGEVFNRQNVPGYYEPIPSFVVVLGR